MGEPGGGTMRPGCTLNKEPVTQMTRHWRIIFGLMALMPLTAGQLCGTGWVPSPVPPDTQPSDEDPDDPGDDPSIPTGKISVTPSQRNFGVVVMGGFSFVESFQVTNVGRADLYVSRARLTGLHASSFTIVGNTCALSSLVPLSTCTVQVMCVPVTPGSLQANLTFDSDDPDTPTLNVPLQALASQY